MSLSRILNNRQTASDFAQRAAIAPRPDVILCSYPTVELSEAAIKYSERTGVPVVLDIRDLWPDTFLNLAPRILRPFSRLALNGMFRASRRICAGAATIVGITDAFVDWGVRRAGRMRRRTDRAFPLAYTSTVPPPAELDSARQHWDEIGVRADVPTLCFFGTLGQQFDISTVLKAARIMRNRTVRFVICGHGDRFEEYRRLAAGIPNVFFPGWVNAAAVRTLMERCIAGLAPYHCETSYTMSLPTKAIEYLAGGLPVLSSLSGELAALLAREDCGETYPEGDAQALVKMVDQLLVGRERCAQMGKNATRVYRAHFVAEAVYGMMIEYLAEVAADAHHQRAS